MVTSGSGKDAGLGRMPTDHEDEVAVRDEQMQGVTLKHEADEDAAMKYNRSSNRPQKVSRASYLRLGWSCETSRLLLRRVSSLISD